MAFITKITLPNGSTYDIRDGNCINPNLLDNPDFAINQQGESYYTTELTVDRWIKNANITVNVVSGGLQLNWTDTSKAGQLIQTLKLDYSALAGRDVTISITAADGTRLSGSGTVPSTPPASDTLVARAQSADVNYKAELHATSTGYYVTIRIVGSTPVIKNVKLELGSAATPFLPPDPVVELLKCQRYYQIHSTGDIAAVDLRPAMATIVDIAERSDGNYDYIAD